MTTALMPAAPEIVAIPLPDGALLLRTTTGDRLHLNRTALAVWSELQRTVDDTEVLEAVASSHGIEPSLVADDVAATLEQLRAFVVGASGGGGSTAAPAGPERSPGSRHLTFSPPSMAGEPSWLGPVGPFQAHALRFVVRAEDSAVLASAAAVFASLGAPDHPTAGSASDDVVTYSIRTHPGQQLGASLWRDDQFVRSAVDGRGALARLIWLVNQEASERPTATAFHAAAVEGSGSVVLLAGESGAGKSTLAAGLVRHGFRYLGDEVTCVDASLRVTGMPKALSLSERSLDALGVPRSMATWLDDDAHVAPDRLRAGSAQLSGTLAAVVLPTYRPDGAWAVEPLDALEAASALLPCVFGGRPFSQADAEVVGRIAGEVPLYRITVPDLAPAVSFIGGLVRSCAPSRGL